jgi:membrane fusion protein, adhesin transport system
MNAPIGRTHWRTEGRVALQALETPRAGVVLARLLVFLLVLGVVLLVVTPWQQNVPGSGRVIAYNPEERPQNVDAPIDGRIVRWYVVEGSEVKAGDPIVDLTDNDPSILQRLEEERETVLRTVDAARTRIRALEDRLAGLGRTQSTGVEAADLRVRMAAERVAAADQALTAARAAARTADVNLERQRALSDRGLTSTRLLELAELEAAQRVADVDRAVASLNAARHEQASLTQEQLRTDADGDTRLDEARAAQAAAVSELERARGDLARIDVRLARQQTQRVTAPVDGTVWRVVARQGGEMLKSGDPLVIVVPTSTRTVVELFLNGNDVPMVNAGRVVRLQFEGWPALQFSGWPSVAVGTFGGRVLLVDATDDGAGRFRVLVEPDPADEPWPSAQYLRQGVRANGWVLLDVVSLGYELWRQFNGFPPVVAMTDSGGSTKGSSGNVVEVGGK